MKIRLLTLVFLAVALTALVSACGDSSDTSSSASVNVPDPCALFTKADAESVLGEPAGAAESSEAEGTRSCSYLSTGASPRMINVIIVKPCSMTDYMNYSEGPLAEPVDGIGMHASWDKAVLLVHSKSGDTCVYASGGGGAPGTDPADDKPALEQAKKVANKVLEQLDA
ncbi:MAG: hypothetical protein Q7K29_01170 [Thermoleophilia bacterium]|nr:hypothetical protein [Thermoleophilia bacterium]